MWKKKGPKAFYNIEIINVSLKHTQYWKIVILAFQNSITKKIADSYRIKALQSSLNADPCFLGTSAINV